jgi:hypothetical protein
MLLYADKGHFSMNRIGIYNLKTETDVGSKNFECRYIIRCSRRLYRRGINIVHGIPLARQNMMPGFSEQVLQIFGS